MKNNEYDTKHLKVLDGIRALAIMIIVWYHFWQQSWLIPRWGFIDLDCLPRYGFLLVDLMILISSFCLFIPYARTMVYKEDIPNTKKFYIKRIARIFPSYYLSLIIAFIFLIIFKDNWYNPLFIKDTLMHLFFVHNFSSDVIVCTVYITALWTVALEVQFYLIFPFVAKKFVKKPVLTYTIMMIVGIVSTIILKKIYNADNMPLYVNHFLTFIPVFANGMLGAWFYITYTKNKKREKSQDVFFTVLSIAAIIGYFSFVKTIGSSSIQVWQINNRLILSCLFMLFIISTCLASKIYQKLFNNRFMVFIATISFNLYIYHAFIAVKLKEFKIPYYSGSTLPNVAGNKSWQWSYTILCIIVSLVVAIIMTYLFEKPIAKLIRKKFKCDA